MMFVPTGSKPLEIVRVKIDDLRPTQITVGKIAAKHKQRKIASLKDEFEIVDYMRNHPVPCVMGPSGHYYVTDHHHLLYAATLEGIKSAYVDIDDDLSYMTKDDFWKVMQSRKWAHPIDEDGTMREFNKIPKKFDELKDDPYRSVATFVRDSNGFTKTTTAYAEFKWAEYFRKNIPIEVVQNEFNRAIALGYQLARAEEAKDLPGWINSVEE